MAFRLHRILGPGIQFAADAIEGERHPVWIQAAIEGVWKGHVAHDRVEFSEQLFDEVIKNFRENPGYKAGEDGIGCKGIIRLDYEHTSEMHPMSGNVPQNGLPAPGFVMELEKRIGPTSKVELWALVEMGEKLWGQVAAGEYRWTSVAVDPTAKDRVTGKRIGNALTSLAITNNPFILGMEDMNLDSTESKAKMSARGEFGYCLLSGTGAQKAQGMILCAMSTYGEAESPEEVLVSLRGTFKLNSTAPAAEVLQELNLFEALHRAGDLPKSIHEDGSWILSSIRELLGMKLLATDEEVFAKAKAILAPLAEKEIADGGMSPAADQVPSNDGGAPAPQKPPENIPMSSTKTLSARIASTLKLSADADDDTVVDAVKSTITSKTLLVNRIAKVLASAKHIKFADGDDEDKLVEAVEGAVEDAEGAETAQEAVNAIEQLLEILEAKDLTEVLAKATKLTEQVTKYSGVVEELNTLKAKLTEGEVEDAEEEVAAIAACHKVEDRTKALLLSQVIHTREEDGKTIRFVNEKGLEQIRKDWPVTDEQAAKRLLTTGLFAGKDGVQKGGAATGVTVAETAPIQDKAPAGASEVQAAIQLCSGRNHVEKAMSYLAEKETVKFSAVPSRLQAYVAGHYFRTGEFPKL